MVNIPMRSSAPMTKQTIMSLNQQRVEAPKSIRDIQSLNNRTTQNAAQTIPAPSAATRPAATPSVPSPSARPAATSSVLSPSTRPTSASPTATTTTATTQAATATAPQTAPPSSSAAGLDHRAVPQLLHPAQKGQKVPLAPVGQLSAVKACLGWNTTNPDCDVDVSAFLLGADGKVIGDDWFVFYGQTASPDNSTKFNIESSGSDRESITIDLSHINVSVQKIVFVLTINEATEKHLNFSMLQDAYVRIFDQTSNNELVSFKMDEYYANVTSMMIGELYQHNGTWKFNAVGNGVARDLAGLCELYGVQVI